MSHKEKVKVIKGCGGGAVYGIGGIGALIYFLQNANGAEEIVIGILKTIVWPAFLVYELFGYLNI